VNQKPIVLVHIHAQGTVNVVNALPITEKMTKYQDAFSQRPRKRLMIVPYRVFIGIPATIELVANLNVFYEDF